MEDGDRPITIITGGSRGIGAATAVQLAKAGHDLTLAYLKDDSAAQDTAAQAQAAGARCVLAKADITCQDDVERLFSITASQLGMVTGVVNNAGVTAHVGDLADTPVQVIRQVIEVNLIGVILCARQASKVMSVRRGGKAEPSSTSLPQQPRSVPRTSTSTTLPPRRQWMHSPSAWLRNSRLTTSASTPWLLGQSAPESTRQAETPAALTASPGTYRWAGRVSPPRLPRPSPGCSGPKPHT